MQYGWEQLKDTTVREKKTTLSPAQNANAQHQPVEMWEMLEDEQSFLTVSTMYPCWWWDVCEELTFRLQ